MSFRTNEEGYPFETSTDDKCFFSLEIADGLDVSLRVEKGDIVIFLDFHGETNSRLLTV